eukprot:4689591-Prymnesium_polylepis.1
MPDGCPSPMPPLHRLMYTFYHSFRPPVFDDVQPVYVDTGAGERPLLTIRGSNFAPTGPVSYTHLRAHETLMNL